MEAKPLRIVPYSHYSPGKGGGPRKKIDRGHAMEGVVEEEKRVLVKEVSSISSSCVELDLGVGATHFAAEAQPTNPVIAARACLFTEAQRRELEHQVFIFRHFANNLPVPQHLVLPVLNSASGTLHSGFGEFRKQYPSYMSVTESGGQGFDYGSMMDPQPHRCRRTDGKKWRCGRNVVPHQKYCERHMHRGRNRSRKPVESSEVNTSLITKPVETSEVNSSLITKHSGKLHTKLASNTESAVSNPNPLGIQLTDSSSCTPSKSCIVNPSSANNKLKNVLGSADCQTSLAPVVTPFSSKTSVTSNNRNSLNTCKKDNHTKSCISNNISGGKGSIICERNGISTGIGFSPRSVLQVSGCDHSYLNDGNSIGLEPGRCRRTDGKKWRCRGAVLPCQKYCASHMHRGAKKRFVDNEPATATTPNSAVTIARLPYSTATSNTQKAYGTTPNTNLSMSIPASAPLPHCNEKSPTSSDTDTTITDTMNEYSCDSY